jgi:hypothetical protein
MDRKDYFRNIICLCLQEVLIIKKFRNQKIIGFKNTNRLIKTFLKKSWNSQTLNSSDLKIAFFSDQKSIAN